MQHFEWNLLYSNVYFTKLCLNNFYVLDLLLLNKRYFETSLLIVTCTFINEKKINKFLFFSVLFFSVYLAHERLGSSENLLF
jgi:hypothetical protein